MPDQHQTFTKETPSMHILLTSDVQLATQKEDAIEAFRRGELDRSTILFEGILEHWPLDPTATQYLASIQEFNDWGIDSSYLTEHWQRVEALMYGEEPLLAPLDSHEALSQCNEIEIPSQVDLSLASAETPCANDELSIELPKELRIALNLFQQGRRKAARMWVKSYTENHQSSAHMKTYLQLLPKELQEPKTVSQSTITEVQELRHSPEMAPHDSNPPTEPICPTPQIEQTSAKEAKQRSWTPYILAGISFALTLQLGEIWFFM